MTKSILRSDGKQVILTYRLVILHSQFDIITAYGSTIHLVKGIECINSRGSNTSFQVTPQISQVGSYSKVLYGAYTHTNEQLMQTALTAMNSLYCGLAGICELC